MNENVIYTCTCRPLTRLFFPALCGKILGHKTRKGSGEMRIQIVSHQTVQCGQSCCSILSLDAIYPCLSNNSSLENGERELGHLFCYCRSCKNTLTIHLREHAYSATGIIKSALFEIWLGHPSNNFHSSGPLLVQIPLTTVHYQLYAIQ